MTGFLNFWKQFENQIALQFAQIFSIFPSRQRKYIDEISRRLFIYLVTTY